MKRDESRAPLSPRYNSRIFLFPNVVCLMLSPMAKPVLGRGLSALLGGVSSTPKTSPFSSAPAQTSAPPAPIANTRERIQQIAVQRVRPCPFQPRKDFSEEAIRELADSIRE